jgi:maltooligosyltrehalose trehalohydrolase
MKPNAPGNDLPARDPAEARPMNWPPLGAQVVDGATRFAVFATRARSCRVEVVAPGDGQPSATHVLQPQGGGLFVATVPGLGHGALYQLWLDDQRYPDPYARFLPEGVHGPAMVVEPRHRWRHGPGVALAPSQRVIYELHVGTFTPEGTFAAAIGRLADLADLGVTAVELMPVSAFAGRWGWGYDGVAHFAPHAGYGTPDDLRRLVDEAHGLGLAMILDVVYNHFGPSGNYLSAFSPEYFTKEIQNAWGDAPNFRLPSMRRYVLDNARSWLGDFRFEGLRLDATHAVDDPSPVHILDELAALAHGLSPRKFLIAEDDRNDAALVKTLGVDAQWADDFHHVVHVTATGERDGYYGNYPPGAATLAETLRGGWLYQGQKYPGSGKPRGTPTQGMTAEAFVYCLQNHDQVGNRAFGERLSQAAGLDKCRALATVLLFAPMTPMLFMGEEWAASSPFQFFTDHESELGQLISGGRRREFQHFTAFSDPAALERIPDPQSEQTFLRSKLPWNERSAGEHARILKLYRSLLRLRRADPVLRAPSRERFEAHAEGDLLVCRRWSGAGERLLLANLSDARLTGDPLRRLLAGRTILVRSDDEAAGDVGRTGGPDALPAWTALIAGGAAADGR